MCTTCGCGDTDKVVLTNLQSGVEEQLARSTMIGHVADHDRHDHEHGAAHGAADHHGHANPLHAGHLHTDHVHDGIHQDHDHSHPHPHHQPHGHDDESHAHETAQIAALAPLHGVTVDLERAILAKNDRLAERNRAWFEGREILALNLVSSPGAGKTSLLERTIRELKDEMPISVIEGDQQTLNDALRIKAAGAPAVQVNTGTGCHLEADMIRRGFEQLRPPFGAVLMIENVGNLVCPALFDLGEKTKVVVLSVTEGDDKPLKYPHMFRAAELMIISKIDLAPYVDFDIARCEAAAREVNPNISSIRLSVRSGAGMQDWYDWLRAARKATALDAAQ